MKFVIKGAGPGAKTKIPEQRGISLSPEAAKAAYLTYHGHEKAGAFCKRLKDKIEEIGDLAREVRVEREDPSALARLLNTIWLEADLAICEDLDADINHIEKMRGSAWTASEVRKAAFGTAGCQPEIPMELRVSMDKYSSFSLLERNVAAASRLADTIELVKNMALYPVAEKHLPDDLARRLERITFICDDVADIDIEVDIAFMISARSGSMSTNLGDLAIS